jgi:hypothetical protein
MRCRREFYAKHPEAQPTSCIDQGEVGDQSNIYTPDEAISLSLEYFKSTTSETEVTGFFVRVTLGRCCVFKNILFPWFMILC